MKKKLILYALNLTDAITDNVNCLDDANIWLGIK